jgi:hypothetical protein
MPIALSTPMSINAHQYLLHWDEWTYLKNPIAIPVPVKCWSSRTTRMRTTLYAHLRSSAIIRFESSYRHPRIRCNQRSVDVKMSINTKSHWHWDSIYTSTVPQVFKSAQAQQVQCSQYHAIQSHVLWVFWTDENEIVATLICAARKCSGSNHRIDALWFDWMQSAQRRYQWASTPSRIIALGLNL